MAARGIVYTVFLFPVIASIVFGSIVMAEVLKEPDRELNMWQFSSDSFVSSKVITILGLEKQYSTSAPVEIEVTVDDRDFDCGDLYITIYDIGSAKKQPITQSGYFGQCFDRNNSTLPLDDEFSEIINAPGNYELVIEMIDKNHKETVSTTEKFTVK